MVNWVEIGRQLFLARRSIALGLCIASLLSYELWRSHAAARAEAERSVSNLVHVMSEQLARTVQSIDLNLQDIVTEIAKDPDLADNDPVFREKLHKRLRTMPYVRALFVIGRDGFISQDTDFPSTPHVNLADREYFRVHERNASIQMHIGGPLKSRSLNVWFISMSRRVSGDQGQFRGIVVAAVEPLYFEHFYKQLWMDSGTILLALDNGTLLARIPQDEQVMGANFADEEPFKSYLTKNRQGVYWGTSPIDSVRRVIGYQHLDSVPVVVLMALDETKMMEEWRSHAKAGIVGTTILLLLLLMLECLARRSRQRDEEARLRLERAQRLEAIGRFAGGLAHDLGNLMRIVRSGLFVLRPMIANNRDALAVVSEIDQSLASGREIVNRLLSQARQTETRLEAADVSHLVSEALPMLVQAAGPVTKINANLPNEEVICFVDKVQFQSAIVNLVLNARDAMPSGGTITIGVRVVEEAVSGGILRFAKIDVQDEGIGMTDDIRHQAFDPFFTTKELGLGNGVGLSQVFEFVQRCNGRVELFTGEGHGTIVTIRLPMEAGSAGGTAARGDEILREGPVRDDKDGDHG